MIQVQNVQTRCLPRHRLGFYGFVIISSAVAVILSVF